jgi:hypothetical protein
MLRFEQASVGREARGLAEVSSKTFHTVYAGELEFGHYFRVQAQSGDFWRWSIKFPVAAESIGEAVTEAEARAILAQCYNTMLSRIGISRARMRKSRYVAKPSCHEVVELHDH